ncbi:MAG: TldD/PmbA family protein [Deltaproteobacteria bacterium]
MPERLFGLVEREVARAGGGDAELCVRRARERRFDARNGGIDALSFSDSVALGVRVFRDGRMGYSYGFSDDVDSVRRMVETAVFCARGSDPDPAHGLPGSAEGAAPATDAALYDPGCESADDDAKARFARELEARTVAFDPRMKRVRSATVQETVAETAVLSSSGVRASGRESAYLAFVDSVAEEGTEGATGHGFAFARRFSELDPGTVAAEGARRAVRMLGAGPLRTGRYAAVLENEAAAELLEVLVPSFLASQVFKGKSMLAGRLGQAVASKAVEIVDDPLCAQGSGAAAFDGEGAPSRRNVLVENGGLRMFLADSFWGRKLGTGSTASCRRRGPKEPPTVGIGNLRIAPGRRDVPGLLREVGSGILLTEFLGIHTADPVSGDFSVGAAGIRFDGGEEREPVRGFAVSGNVLALLARVAEAGSDFRWFGNVGSPSLAIPAMDVGGS